MGTAAVPTAGNVGGKPVDERLCLWWGYKPVQKTG
jgi:hypothetical protein